MLLVVALAVTLTILVTRDGSDGNSPTPPGDGQASEFASANDTGPVNIITEDPTCDAWGRVSRDYSQSTEAAGWAARNAAVPASGWTPEQRAMYESVGESMMDASNKVENLVKLTTHRAMRELYQQFRAYSRSFVGRIPSYEPKDDDLAVVVDNLASGLAMICSAADYGSAQAVSPLVQAAPDPSNTPSLPVDASEDYQFLSASSPSCSAWDAAAKGFSLAVRDWREIDANIAAVDWTPNQRRVIDETIPVMMSNADTLVRLGGTSENAVFEDFAYLAAQYRRGYAAALPDYTSADNYLSAASTYVVNAVLWACKAAQ
ncbi:hypothetical protein [Mycobacterium sp. IS-1496]|uniref:hypothetical protein n=1 Tax=Mycobacterium sp. IS-1496 TaxID=1772284 RepID=UPI002570855A|nr:hypothetical protein [Mycobacterium sp. IS-1496]